MRVKTTNNPESADAESMVAEGQRPLDQQEIQLQLANLLDPFDLKSCLDDLSCANVEILKLRKTLHRLLAPVQPKGETLPETERYTELQNQLRERIVATTGLKQIPLNELRENMTGLKTRIEQMRLTIQRDFSQLIERVFEAGISGSIRTYELENTVDRQNLRKELRNLGQTFVYALLESGFQRKRSEFKNEQMIARCIMEQVNARIKPHTVSVRSVVRWMAGGNCLPQTKFKTVINALTTEAILPDDLEQITSAYDALKQAQWKAGPEKRTIFLLRESADLTQE